MQLSKTAYYADFVIYAAIIAALAGATLWTDGWEGRLRWIATLLIGMVLWTLLEYLLHRFVLHTWPIFSPMHAVHHRLPKAFVGTPTWITLAILGVTVFLPTWWRVSFNAASGLLAGVMMGFMWYGVLHHAIHHRRPRALAARIPTLIRRHLKHHHVDRPINFGVTTLLWDRLFGTAEREHMPRRP